LDSTLGLGRRSSRPVPSQLQGEGSKKGASTTEGGGKKTGERNRKREKRATGRLRPKKGSIWQREEGDCGRGGEKVAWRNTSSYTRARKLPGGAGRQGNPQHIISWRGEKSFPTRGVIGTWNTRRSAFSGRLGRTQAVNKCAAWNRKIKTSRYTKTRIERVQRSARPLDRD